jgi:hypothetical protein
MDQQPSIGRIVIFNEAEITAPAMITKVEDAMEGVVPAVSLTVFCEGGELYRTTVPYWATLEAAGDIAASDSGPAWRWPERV